MAPFKFPRVVTRTKLQDCVLCWLQWERNKATLSVFKDVTFELPVSLPWGSNVCNWETFFSRMKSQDSLSSSLALKLNNIVWFFFKHYKQWNFHPSVHFLHHLVLQDSIKLQVLLFVHLQKAHHLTLWARLY